MKQRLNFLAASPESVKPMFAMEAYLKNCGLEHSLIHLVKMRASQINGCAYCFDMHSKDARAIGETEQRLYTLDAWRETPFYSPRERAALAWTEALTLIAQTHAPDDVFEDLRAHFSEREIADLTFVITTINAWNRIAIGFRAEVGKYKAGTALSQVAAAHH